MGTVLYITDTVPIKLAQVLKLFGWDSTAIAVCNGSTTREQRTKELNRFKTDSRCRILLLSRVGLHGLNIANANIMVMLVSSNKPLDRVLKLRRIRYGRNRKIGSSLDVSGGAGRGRA